MRLSFLPLRLLINETWLKWQHVGIRMKYSDLNIFLPTWFWQAWSRLIATSYSLSKVHEKYPFLIGSSPSLECCSHYFLSNKRRTNKSFMEEGTHHVLRITRCEGKWKKNWWKRSREQMEGQRQRVREKLMNAAWVIHRPITQCLSGTKSDPHLHADPSSTTVWHTQPWGPGPWQQGSCCCPRFSGVSTQCWWVPVQSCRYHYRPVTTNRTAVTDSLRRVQKTLMSLTLKKLQIILIRN